MPRAIGEEVHGGPAPFTLGEKTYLVSPLGPYDGDTLRKFLSGKLKSPLRAAVDDLAGIDPKFHEAALKAAATVNASGSALTSAAIDKILLTGEGCRFVFWISARKALPTLTLEDLVPFITDENAAEVLVKISEAIGLDRLGKA